MSDKFVEELRTAHLRLAQTMRTKWDRDLPLGELISDRWERARELGFGAGTSVYESSYLYGDVSVGANTWIGPFTLLDGTGGLRIGDFCSISAGVHIYTHDTVAWALTGGKQQAVRSRVSIGDNTYIGSQSVVARGVSVGDHCVIGANSFVNRSIPAFSVAIGSPCRVVGTVEIGADGHVRLEFHSKSHIEVQQ